MTISCNTTIPTQEDVVAFFNSYVADLNSTWKTSLVKLKEYKISLAEGNKVLSDLLLIEYNNIVDQYNTELSAVENLIGILDPFPLSVPITPYNSISSLGDLFPSLGKALTTEYSTYVLQKFLSIIATVIPVNLNIPAPFFGTIDLTLLVGSEQYRNNLKKQIAQDLPTVKSLIGKPYSDLFSGDISDIKSEDIQVQEIFQYYFQIVSQGAVSVLHSALGSLISTFDEIWDALNLPNLVPLLTLDVETLINNVIDSIKSAYDTLIDDLVSTYQQVQQNFTLGLASLQDVETAKQNLNDAIKEKGSELVDGILSIGLFNITLSDIINIDTTNPLDSVEQNISNLTSQAKDWAYKYPLSLIVEWMDKVKSFFQAIGLSSLIQWIDFNFCDFLELVGIQHN